MSVLISLWNFIYSEPGSTISGYTFNQMIWYLLLAEVITFGSGSSVATDEIRNCIKSGNIAYNINKPYSYIGYSLSSHMSEASLRGVLYTVAGMVMGLVLLGPIKDFNLISIPFIVLSVILATMINVLLVICIGLTAFWVEDSGPFYWVYSKLILVFGTMFPIEYFPKIVQSVLNYSPVYVTTYGPAKLFVDFDWMTFILIIGAQLIYLLFASLLANLIYRKGVRRLNVNGG